MQVLFFSVIVVLSLQEKLFPSLNHHTIDGKQITNAYFQGKKTIVVHMHLGCAPAMVLLKDLQEFSETTQGYQVLVITENTSAQVKAFNSPDPGIWSEMRNHFEMDPVAFDIIAECDEEILDEKDGTIVLVQQCRRLAKKLKTRSSPTWFLVNETGAITMRNEGYSITSNVALIGHYLSGSIKKFK